MNLKLKIKLFLYNHHSMFAGSDTQFYLIKYNTTRLAVCNCLSFTFRLGDLPSPLMFFFSKFDGRAGYQIHQKESLQ